MLTSVLSLVASSALAHRAHVGAAAAQRDHRLGAAPTLYHQQTPNRALSLLRGGADDDDDDELDAELDDADGEAELDADGGLENPFLSPSGAAVRPTPPAGGAAASMGGLEQITESLKDPKMLQQALKELQDPATQQRFKEMMEDPEFLESMKQYAEQITQDPQFEQLKAQAEQMMKDPSFMEEMQKAMANPEFLSKAMASMGGTDDEDK